MRILSLHPATTEILFAIGAGGNIIGRTEECDWPEMAKKIPSIGPVKDVTEEKVLIFQPDLVLTGFGQEDLAASLATSCKVAKFTPHTLEGIRSGIASLGEITSHQLEAEMILHEINALLERATLKCAKYHTFKVYAEANQDSLAPQYIQEILSSVGAEPYDGELSFDALHSFDPYLILLCDPDGLITSEIASARNGWNGLTAVQHERVFQMDPVLLYRPGPRLLDGIKGLAKLIHGVELNSES